MKVKLTTGLCCLLFAAFGLAQSTTRIDGRIHPELITDDVALRIVLLMHSHFATPEEGARSEQFHSQLQLIEPDHQTYDRIVKSFRLKYDNLVEAHNAFIDTSSSLSAAGFKDEMKAHDRSVSLLVQATREELTGQLTRQGSEKLMSFVQNEKVHMVVGVRSAQ